MVEYFVFICDLDGIICGIWTIYSILGPVMDSMKLKSDCNGRNWYTCKGVGTGNEKRRVSCMATSQTLLKDRPRL